MENKNEIMTTEEVMDTTEENVTESSGVALLALGLVGGVVLIGGLAYRHGVKPMLAKRKAKKEQDDGIVDVDAEIADVEDEKVEDEVEAEKENE